MNTEIPNKDAVTVILVLQVHLTPEP